MHAASGSPQASSSISLYLIKYFDTTGNGSCDRLILMFLRISREIECLRYFMLLEPGYNLSFSRTELPYL